MGKLAVLLEGALTSVEIVLAHLGLVLLLQGVKLVAVEVLVVGVLGQVAYDLRGRVVEVLLGLPVVS